jgi:pilus assembly protein FimV
MNCINRISAAAMLAAAALSFSPVGWALGLGDATVESFLNQPLRARIDLITQETDDLTAVSARLASADDYALIGASLEAVQVPIRFSIEDIDGEAYLAASSSLPISSPVLRLIVEVNWSSGRMLREYTLFLDPPAVPEAAPAPRISQREPAPVAPAQRAPTAPPQPAPAPAPVPAARPAPQAAAADGGEYGPVRSGENLWNIASDWSRGSGLNINQVMIAIQRENPQAFINGNINLLKRGAILRLPPMADIGDVSRGDANRAVREQLRAMENRSTVASAAVPLVADEATAASQVEAAPDVSAAEAVPSEAEELAESAASEAEPAPEASRDVLELVPPSADSELDSAAGFEESDEVAEVAQGAEALRENLARAEEELINQRQQNTYLEERIQELESQLEIAEQARVESAEAAAMEQRLREQRLAEAAARERPWYRSISIWIIALLVLAAAFVGWFLTRRGQAAEEAAEAAEQSLRGLQSEAEDVLRVLEEESAVPAQAEGPRPARAADSEVEDAELLDTESSDPEIQLDLARAYISMGDKEAARVILNEVLSNGTEKQLAEAQKMLDLLDT